MPPVNYLAVAVSAVAIFMLGGLWYSPLLFANKWVALQGKTREELMASGAGPMMYVQVFICGLLTAFMMGLLIARLDTDKVMTGLKLAVICWLGFAGATSYGTALFSSKPKGLWLIDTGFNFVAFVVAGVILALWR